jgi:hypothetical protein
MQAEMTGNPHVSAKKMRGIVARVPKVSCPKESAKDPC